ncbi:MAG: FMN-binding protein [Planctomycetes bacterium]|nr:FMN-binding protein [Planctomycetota bacterium]
MKIDTRHPVYVVAFAAVSALVLTGLIMALHAAAQSRITLNEQAMRQGAIVEILFVEPGDTPWGKPGGQLDDWQITQLFETRVREVTIAAGTEHEMRIFVAYKQDAPKGQPPIDDGVLRYAVPIGGQAFWGPIRGYISLSPDFTTIGGIVFTQQSETPGLGGEIMRPYFRNQFQGLRGTMPPPEGKYVYVGGPSAEGRENPRAQRRVDAITGATATSNAVERIVNNSLAAFMEAAQGMIRPATEEETK